MPYLEEWNILMLLTHGGEFCCAVVENLKNTSSISK